MKYFGKYTTSGDVQTALDASAITNPYVALVGGNLDYNTLTPTPPAPQTMGNWTEDGTGGHYFTITEEDTNYWYDDAYIGTLNNVEYAGGYTAMDITLAYSGGWNMIIKVQGGENSDSEVQTFEEGTQYNWETGVMSTGGDSDAAIYVEWDGDNTFAFYSGSVVHPISITTHDPEYPAA